MLVFAFAEPRSHRLCIEQGRRHESKHILAGDIGVFFLWPNKCSAAV